MSLRRVRLSQVDLHQRENAEPGRAWFAKSGTRKEPLRERREDTPGINGLHWRRELSLSSWKRPTDRRG
jgi:hypothetical protein